MTKDLAICVLGTNNVPREKYCLTIEFIEKVAEHLRANLHTPKMWMILVYKVKSPYPQSNIIFLIWILHFILIKIIKMWIFYNIISLKLGHTIDKIERVWC